MNECHFLGNLTRDPELRTTKSDKKVVKVGIAVNRHVSKEVKETAFLDCEAWDSGAELIEKYFKKGDPIIVHCSLRQDSWTDKDGNKRTSFVFRINKFEFVPGGKRGGDAPGEEAGPARRQPAAQAASAGKGEDDDIPF